MCRFSIQIPRIIPVEQAGQESQVRIVSVDGSRCRRLAIAATMATFWQRSSAAGILFVPYLAWVSFASFLNFTIWRLNG
ncbi:MAG: TspO/MBR family protein [Thermoguttaceae bacterium]